MKKALLAALLAGGVSAGNANELGKLMTVCAETSATQEEVVRCQQLMTDLWFKADAVARSRVPVQTYAPAYRPDTKCTAVQNVFGNWDMRCY